MRFGIVLVLLGCGLWLGCRLFPPRVPLAAVVSVQGGTERLVEVPPGETRVDFRFTLHNTGRTAIPRPRMQRSCNCIDATYEPDVLHPGATSEVALRIVLASLERASGSGTIRLKWEDGSSTPLSFRVARHRVPGLVLSPASLTHRAIAAREHPTLSFVADYFPEQPPGLEQFEVRLDGHRPARLEGVRQVGAYALAGRIVLEPDQMALGGHRVTGTDLDPTALEVR